MLIILLIFALIRTLRGVPVISSLDVDPNGFPDLILRDASSHFGERAISDIILSCFATIFACTWSAVHPNIPAPTDCAWTRFKRQLVTMVYALLAPEAITAWALRQRLAARGIVDDYNKKIAKHNGPEPPKSNFLRHTMRTIFYDSPLPSKLHDGQVPKWTLAHGFFLQMGGFMLSDGGRPIQTLDWGGMDTDIELKINDGTIDLPSTTEEDIQDRSKGDAISKTLIILQTTWFIAQCIARWTNRLPVTKLEVVTLGFAMLNGITYGLWWHKPQNVGRPVFLQINCKPQESSDANGDSSFANKSSSPRPTGMLEDPEAQSQESDATQTPSNSSEILQRPDHLRHILRQDIKRHAPEPWRLLYLIPLCFIKGLLRPLAKLAEYNWRIVDSGALRVPMFYSARADDWKVYMLTTLIGVLFGSVHLITSWFLDFASVREMWLWRISAIIIMVEPIFLGVDQYSPMDSILVSIGGIFLLLGLPLYIISRIVLLTLALTSLRALPTAALQTVDWTTFIPHI